jgi:coronin-1B/1C/6
VTCVQYNPAVRDIVASGSVDGTVRIWYNGEQKLLLDVGDEKCGVESIAWNPEGSLIATVGRDKKLRVFDVRAQKLIEGPVDAHVGVKQSRVVWLGDSGMLATSGFSKARDRQVSLWRVGSLASGAVKTYTLDQSTGVLELLYDEDAHLLFVAGRGDSMIRVYELIDDALSEMSAATSDAKPSRGCCVLPKRGVDVMSCEVGRLFKAQADSVVPISVVVPRKSKRDFSEIAELYPPSRGPNASLDAAAWLSGGASTAPARTSMDPHLGAKQEKAVATAAAAAAAAGTAEVAAAKAPVVSAKTVAAMALIRSTHFRHVSGKQVKNEEHYDGLRALASAGMHL